MSCVYSICPTSLSTFLSMADGENERGAERPHRSDSSEALAAKRANMKSKIDDSKKHAFKISDTMQDRAINVLRNHTDGLSQDVDGEDLHRTCLASFGTLL